MIRRIEDMTSSERHELRYQRRKAKRLEKIKERSEKYCDYDKIISVNELHKSFYNCRKGVRWKPSVQRYEMNLLPELVDLHDKLEREEDISRGFVKFSIVERGKKRNIQSCHISERVVQKSFSDNCLVPLLSELLIYNNGATLKGKGCHFAINKLKSDLSSAYRRYGRGCYIILGDFHNYFGSIPHDKLYERLDRYILDDRVRKYYKSIVDKFDSGLGLGSQVDQIFSVFYPNELDHFITCTEGIKYYGRYMDDFYLIVETKERAHDTLGKIESIVSDLGLEMNQNKTQIVKMKRGFTYMKTKFIITETGKVVTCPSRQNIARERRLLKSFKKKMDNGEMVFKQVENSYTSWLGYMKHKKSYKSTNNMNKLYNKLFIEDWGHEYG